MRLRGTAICAALLVLGPLLAPVLATPARADSSTDAASRVASAASALEDSTAAVRAAAASLSVVAEQLPAARREVAVARGELAGAQARLAAATTQVVRAQLATAAAQRRVDATAALVQSGRDTVGLLARRSYQQGPLGDLREILRAGSPQDLIDRAETLRAVFRTENDVLHHLSVDRLHLATQTADLAAQQRDLQAAQLAAAAGAETARQGALRADAAAARVAGLIAQRSAALAAATAGRAADLKEYKAAQAASQALAAKLRALARARALAAARNHTSTARPSSARFLWPADGPLTSPYGWRMHPIYHEMRFHAGIDIGAGYGAPVWAGDAGTVVYAGQASGYGTLVVISHGTVDGTDLSTAYAHMSALLVSDGQRVTRGQEIGRVGNEGNSTGPHLHFEVRRDGNPVDPMDWVSPP